MTVQAIQWTTDWQAGLVLAGLFVWGALVAMLVGWDQRRDARRLKSSVGAVRARRAASTDSTDRTA